VRDPCANQGQFSPLIFAVIAAQNGGIDVQPRINLARLMMLVSIACGVIGLVVGLADRSWKLGVTGWFTGGTLLAILALVVLADEYFARRRADS
jgi:hypothetical protein